MLRKGFQLLEKRVHKIDIEKFEKQYSQKLPPIYRLFVETFELTLIVPPKIIKEGNAEFFLDRDFFRSGIFTDDEYINAIGLKNGGIGFERFKILENVFKHKDNDDDWIEDGCMPIGICGDNALFLGYHDNNMDYIYFQSRFLPDNEMKKIANNIFEFVSYIEEFIFNRYVDNKTIKKSHKLWGEKNWRVT